jgi:hypothetical protein
MRRCHFARLWASGAFCVRNGKIDPDPAYQFLPVVKKINLDQ